MPKKRVNVNVGDTVQLTYSPDWDGIATVTNVSKHAIRLRMVTGGYAGAVGTFAWRDSNEWTVRKVQAE